MESTVETAMSAASLVAVGFRRFDDPMHRDQFHRGSYQFRVEDEVGTRYFVNVVHYVLPAIGKSFQAEVQFTRGEETVNLSYFATNRTVEQTLAFFAQAWSALSFDHYERNS
jgi:hypothetical protein